MSKLGTLAVVALLAVAGCSDDGDTAGAGTTTTVATTSTTAAPTTTTSTTVATTTTVAPTPAEQIRQAHEEAESSTGAVAAAAADVLATTCDLYRNDAFNDGTVELEEAIAQYCPEAEPLTPADFAVELVVLESQCFGSAGGTIEAEPELTLNTGRTDGVWQVTYEVTNLEHGPELYTIEVDMAEGSYTYDALRLSTASCEDQPAVSVTAVRER